jgi:hypothetical protein
MRNGISLYFSYTTFGALVIWLVFGFITFTRIHTKDGIVCMILVEGGQKEVRKIRLGSRAAKALLITV